MTEVSDPYPRSKRSKRHDGLWPRFRVFALQNFAPFWRVVEKIPFLAKRLNTFMINTACNAAAFRPHPFSTVSDYTSWKSLTDKAWLARAIAPEQTERVLPSLEDTTALFAPKPHEPQRICRKSTLLFPIFAQYLTDGFLRTDLTKGKRDQTTSNHDIDLSPLYGRTEAQTNVLRLCSPKDGEKGRLKSQILCGEEFPPFLYKPGTTDIHEDFCGADGKPILDPPLGLDKAPKGTLKDRKLFAQGGDRANSTALISMINTLWLREHNRLAGLLEKNNPQWGDDRVFETARNIVIVMFIKLVVEEYINHISSACFRLKADPSAAWEAKWNKPNWMTVEFSLLYRWHSLIPQQMQWDGKSIDVSNLLLDNRKIISAGLAKGFLWSAQTNAARLDLHNTPIFLENMLTVESLAIKQNRDLRLRGYNAYREALSRAHIKDWDCVTGDPDRQVELKNLYGTPGNMDFYVALFAEDAGENTPMSPLLGAMVALDAFSQALNNPLFSKQVYHAGTFSDDGMREIESTTSLWDVLKRNMGGTIEQDIGAHNIRMTRADWKRRFVGF